MKAAGRVEIAASPEDVWAFLLDPQRVGPCLPGVEAIERLEDGRFRARARVGGGLFSTVVEIVGGYEDLDPPRGATLTGRGTGIFGSSHVTARFELEPGAGGGTIVSWTAEVTLAGLAATLEGRLADGTADRAVAGVLDCVRARLEA